MRDPGKGCGIQGREQRGVQEPSSDVRLSSQGRAVPAGSSHLPQDELAAGYPVLRQPGESPPSPLVGRAGPGRAVAFTFSLFSRANLGCHSPSTPGEAEL